MKVAGLALLILATVGILASWSAMTQAVDGGAYVLANALLVIAGLVLLVVAVRRERSAKTSPPDSTSTT